ncbi:MAG: serpin family protein [Gammaproteobacteria bacterium]|nr:serpin family protein [Gammaproteobacteria bacterium]
MSDTPSIVESTSRFALDLYHALGSSDGNLFFSPASIAVALTMAHAGAKGGTAQQMAEVLHLPDLQPARLHAAFGFLISDLMFEYAQPYSGFSRLDSDDTGAVDPTACQVRMANALWGQVGLGYLEVYKHALKSFYESDLHEVDFAADPEHAREIINRWVAERTREKIPQLLPSGALDEITLLVITNAVYFKAQWDEPFEESLTEPQPFLLESGAALTTDMMCHTTTFRYTQDDLVRVLELPYMGNRFSMLIILPREKNGLAAVEPQLSYERLREWQATLAPAMVNVRLPRFEFRQPLMLADVLQEMGMRLAFSDAADFSGITNKAPLMIGQVLHEAFINLDEKGTEAAAATALAMVLGEAEPEELPPVIEFHADHPFLFAIAEQANGALLFLGRVKNPQP